MRAHFLSILILRCKFQNNNISLKIFSIISVLVFQLHKLMATKNQNIFTGAGFIAVIITFLLYKNSRKESDKTRTCARPNPQSIVAERKENSMKQKNTLTKLGHALKTSPKKANTVSHQNRRNLPVVHNNRRHPTHRNQQYSDHYGAERVNRIRTAIVNSDGSYIAIDVYSHSRVNARRRYRNIERR